MISGPKPKNRMDLSTFFSEMSIPVAESYFNRLPNAPCSENLNELAREINECHVVVDKKLTVPALWHGVLRREIGGYIKAGEKDRYVNAFNWLMTEIAQAKYVRFNTEMLCAIHDTAVGGANYRTGYIWIGKNKEICCADPKDISGMVEALFSSVESTTEDPVIIAARLHLALIQIHPFWDGNGRTSRLITALWLARAGYRSTLFTAVEQHFKNIQQYSDIFNLNRQGKITDEKAIALLLKAMVENVLYITWFRRREHILKLLCNYSGIPPGLHDQALAEYDLDPSACNGSKLPRQLKHSIPPLYQIMSSINPIQKRNLGVQIWWLLNEENAINAPLQRQINYYTELFQTLGWKLPNRTT